MLWFRPEQEVRGKMITRSEGRDFLSFCVVFLWHEAKGYSLQWDTDCKKKKKEILQRFNYSHYSMQNRKSSQYMYVLWALLIPKCCSPLCSGYLWQDSPCHFRKHWRLFVMSIWHDGSVARKRWSLSIAEKCIHSELFLRKKKWLEIFAFVTSLP